MSPDSLRRKSKLENIVDEVVDEVVDEFADELTETKAVRSHGYRSRYMFGTRDGSGSSGVECFVTFYDSNVVNMKKQCTVEMCGEEFEMDKEVFLKIAQPAP